MKAKVCVNCNYKLQLRDFANHNLHGKCQDGDVLCPQCGRDSGWSMDREKAKAMVLNQGKN